MLIEAWGVCVVLGREEWQGSRALEQERVARKCVAGASAVCLGVYGNQIAVQSRPCLSLSRICTRHHGQCCRLKATPIRSGVGGWVGAGYGVDHKYNRSDGANVGKLCCKRVFASGLGIAIK